MAILIPSYESCASRMTPGEWRFAQRLRSHLEDDYCCWYNVPVGRSRRYPGFILLHARRGLLILEVKDWSLGSLPEMDKVSASLLTDQGLKRLPNPLEQARRYALVLSDMLVRDPGLRVPEGEPHQGRLIVPYGYGVVLSRIPRRKFEESGLGEVIDPGRVSARTK